MGDMMGFGEVTNNLGKAGGFNVLVGNEVVRDKDDAVLIKDGAPNLFKFLDGRRCCNIVCKDAVEPAGDEVTWFNEVLTCVFGEDFVSWSFPSCIHPFFYPKFSGHWPLGGKH